MRWMVAAMASLLLLAGCTQPPATEDPGEFVDPDSVELAAGKGAIAGLLYDDRFRPIELRENPETEFQAAGFVLLLETGAQALTTANGEFSFVDLDPGTYTLRASVEGHEAKSTTVVVEEGAFAEATIQAYRVLDAGSYVYTQEFMLFQFCGLNAILVLSDFCNALDQSGDSGRASIEVDFTGVDNLTVVVSEFLADNEGDYEVWIGHCMACLDLSAEYYAQTYIDGDYGRCTSVIGVPAEDCTDRNAGNHPFTTENVLQYVIWVNGMMDEETGAATFGLSTGIGGQLAFKGRLLLSAFVGEPTESVESYCLLCE